MFTIDLLKGKALPVEVNLKKVILRMVPVLIPILALTAFAAVYHQDQTVMLQQQEMLDQQQKQLEQYTKDVAEYTLANKQIKGMEKCLKDISTALNYRIQVSDILTELVEPLPEPIFIYEIKMDRSSQMEKIQEAEGQQAKQQLVVSRNLKLVVCGFDSGQSDVAVQDYIRTLQASTSLSKIFTEIKPSVRKQGKVDQKDAIFYEIECVLQEQR